VNAGAIALILAAMKQHPGDEDLQLNAFIALHNLKQTVTNKVCCY
jgi:hypothetical protein